MCASGSHLCWAGKIHRSFRVLANAGGLYPPVHQGCVHVWSHPTSKAPLSYTPETISQQPVWAHHCYTLTSWQFFSFFSFFIALFLFISSCLSDPVIYQPLYLISWHGLITTVIYPFKLYIWSLNWVVPLYLIPVSIMHYWHKSTWLFIHSNDCTHREIRCHSLYNLFTFFIMELMFIVCKCIYTALGILDLSKVWPVDLVLSISVCWSSELCVKRIFCRKHTEQWGWIACEIAGVW